MYRILTERLTKTSAIALFVVWVAASTQVSMAQETTYSADSLMTAFKQGSQISLKGTEITFTAVVDEIKRSSVVFRSSGNDKVICEVISTTDKWNQAPVVGRPLTVKGKVRGRGLLGNVTLNQCNPVVASVASTAPAPAPVEPPHGAIDDPTEYPDETTHQLPVTAAIEETAPVTAPVDEVAPKPISPPRSLSAMKDVRPKPPQSLPPDKPAEPEQAPTESQPPTRSPLGSAILRSVFLALVVVLSIIGAVSVFVKVRPAIATAFRRQPGGPVSEEVRRAALERLLLGKKKSS